MKYFLKIDESFREGLREGKFKHLELINHSLSEDYFVIYTDDKNIEVNEALVKLFEKYETFENYEVERRTHDFNYQIEDTVYIGDNIEIL